VVNLSGSVVVPFNLSKKQQQLQKGLVMKVLLMKDVYKLGRAGDIKKVADGFGRNYLVPQGLALPATPGSIKLAASIGKKATEQRVVLNNEFKGIADLLVDLTLEFVVKAGETGKLYGSVTNQMVAEKVKELKDLDLDRRQIAMEPIRNVGEYKIPVHLTIDLIPELTVNVRREGEVARAQPTRFTKLEHVVVVTDKVEEAAAETPATTEE
jgi:large subunit ribosomal protein L9